MCEPISIALGVASFAGSAASAVGQHQQQAAATARSNAIAKQQYQQQLQIAAAEDQEKGRAYKAELKATAAGKEAYYAQLSANQQEGNRARLAQGQKDKEAQTSALFQTQNNIASSIQAQGQLLSAGKAGQSYLLQVMDVDRKSGFKQAEIDQTLYDQNVASGFAREGALLDQFSADAAAWNNLPADPLSPMASFMPIKPIKAQGPSGLALAGNLVSGAAGAVGTGISTYTSVTGKELKG